MLTWLPLLRRIRMLISAEASPLELFENILTQQEARDKPHLLERPGNIVDDNLGFSKVSGADLARWYWFHSVYSL